MIALGVMILAVADAAVNYAFSIQGFVGPTGLSGIDLGLLGVLLLVVGGVSLVL